MFEVNVDQEKEMDQHTSQKITRDTIVNVLNKFTTKPELCGCANQQNTSGIRECDYTSVAEDLVTVFSQK
jgi:hypothetical protein